MKTYSLLLALLFLISCSSIPFLNNSQNTIEEKVTGARGIIINFVKDQPPTQITEKERFYIALTAENNLPEATTVTTIMYPDLTLTMTPDDLQNFQSITLEGSNYNDLQELSAAAKTTGDKKATKFTPGTISQTTAKITEDKRILLGPYTILLDHNYPEEETKFFLDYAYDIKATMTASYCAYDPSTVKKISCPEELTEAKLGPAKYLPITITKIEKKLRSIADNNYEVHLWIYLEDKGKGNVKEVPGTPTSPTDDLSKYLLSHQGSTEKIQLTLHGQENYQCQQDPYYGKEQGPVTGFFSAITGYDTKETTVIGNYPITMNNGKALLKCYTTFTSKQPTETGAEQDIKDHIELPITISYRYQQQLVTPTITIRRFE